LLSTLCHLRIQDSSIVAVKQLSRQALTQNEIRDFEREIAVMKNLRPHRNVITLFGYCLSPLCIVTEYCNSGSLYQLLQDGKLIKEEFMFKIVYGIVAGMNHLHIEGIIHRDLAARNILLNQSDVKVCDFGMSRLISTEVESSNQTENTVGPLRWMSPESLNERVYSTKTDVYSFGCVIYEILTKQNLLNS